MNDSPNRRYDVTVTVARMPEPCPTPHVCRGSRAGRDGQTRWRRDVRPLRRADHHRGNRRDAPDRPSAVAVAVAVVSEALTCPVASPSRCGRYRPSWGGASRCAPAMLYAASRWVMSRPRAVAPHLDLSLNTYAGLGRRHRAVLTCLTMSGSFLGVLVTITVTKAGIQLGRATA
jgi:hypothetical protein